MRQSSLLFTTATALLLVACGGAKDPKAELAQLEKEQQENQAKIAALKAKAGAAAPNADAQAQPAVPVAALVVKPTNFKSYLEVQGRVDFDQNAAVAARAAGTLTSIRVVRGDRVGRGQVLATIDASVLDASVAELRTRLDLARTVYERQAGLWKEQIGTEIQYLTAKNNYESLQRNLSTFSRQRELYNVVAPFAGTVDEVLPKLGEAVAPGAPVARLVSGTGGKILAEVSENYASSIKPGDQALVTIPDVGAEEFSSTVRVVSRSISAASRTFTVELRLNGNRANQLRPNMVATVRIQNYAKQNVPVVPVDAVQRDEQNAYVFVVGGGNKAEKRVIKTGQTYNGRVEVTNGLQANDKVITAGYENLNEGQVVSL